MFTILSSMFGLNLETQDSETSFSTNIDFLRPGTLFVTILLKIVDSQSFETVLDDIQSKIRAKYKSQ